MIQQQFVKLKEYDSPQYGMSQCCHRTYGSVV